MLRKNEPIGEIDVELLVAGQPTVNSAGKPGNIYSLALLEKIANDINEKGIDIEEVAPADRYHAKIPLCFPWKERAMAESTKAVVEDGRLKVHFSILGNRYGNILKKTIDNNNVIYKLVGKGNTVPEKPGNPTSNNVVTDFEIFYVTFEVLKDG